MLHPITTKSAARITVKPFILAALCLATAFFTACNDQWYNVPDKAEPYVDAFDQYANEHGYKFDFEEAGLIIEFTDIADDTVSRCNYEDPIRIEIDTDSWHKANENRREEIILKNLSLGFLNRHNTNQLFPNNEWSSIMRGRPFDVNQVVYEGINFFGFRKNHYIDELFDEDTNPPWWSDYTSSYESIPTDVLEIVYQEEFLETDDDWSGSNQTFNANPDNGQLEILNDSDEPCVHLREIDYNADETFLIECIFKLESGNKFDINGLVWGGNDDSAYYIAGYSMNKAVCLHNNEENHTYLKFHNPMETLDNVNAYHKISLYYDEEYVHMFMDEEFIYITDIHDIYGSVLGFLTGANSKLIVDRLLIYQ